jgi:hypothetical protein
MLIDEMIDIPALLHDLNVLSALPADMIGLGDISRDIFLRVVTIAENLRNWLAGFTSRYPIPYAWTASVSEAGSSCFSGSNMFPFHFQFPNLLAAQSLLHYWAAIVILMRCIQICQSINASAIYPTQRFGYDAQELVYSLHISGGIALSEPSVVALHLADNICQSVAYGSHHDNNMAGPTMLLFPLWLAKDTYANDESGLSFQKEAYCVEVFKKIAGRGMQISSALISLSTRNTVKTCYNS